MVKIMEENECFWKRLIKSKYLREIGEVDYFDWDNSDVIKIKNRIGDKIGKIVYDIGFEATNFDVKVVSYEKCYHKEFLAIARAIEKYQKQRVILITNYNPIPKVRKTKR